MKRFEYKIFFAVIVLWTIWIPVRSEGSETILRVKTDAYFEVVKESHKIRVNIDDYGTYFFMTDWYSIDKINRANIYLSKVEAEELTSMIDSLLFLPINYSLRFTSGFVEVPLRVKSKKRHYIDVELSNQKLSSMESGGEDVKTVNTPARIIIFLTKLKNKIPANKYRETAPEIIYKDAQKNTEFKFIPEIKSYQPCAFFKISNDTVFFARGAFRGNFRLNKEEYNKTLDLLNRCNSVIYCCPFKFLGNEGHNSQVSNHAEKHYVIEAEPNNAIAPDKLLIDNITYMRLDTALGGTPRDQHLIYTLYSNNVELSDYERFMSYVFSLCDKYIIKDPTDRYSQKWLSRNKHDQLYYNKY